MSGQGIFIAATGQHVGKTTCCLGILSGLCKRLGKENVGFIKPVGQEHVKIHDQLHVDKDVRLFKEHFELSSSYEEMSPVLIPKGFTRQFLDGSVSAKVLQERILTAYQIISSTHAYTIVEGTGHVGVGSIVDLNNAQVAALLGLEVILIASGGLGSSIDELSLNIAKCEKHNVSVRGVILNRVIPEKQEMILDYFPRALKKWGIPLIGTIPYNHLLSKPCIRDFELLFKTELLSGHAHRYRHFHQTRLVATTFDVYNELIEPKQLVITPASREDIVLATLAAHTESRLDGIDLCGGMILTGRRQPSPKLLEVIQASDIPILYAPVPSYDAMKKITSFTAKTRRQDLKKVEEAKHLVEDNLNFDVLNLGASSP